MVLVKPPFVGPMVMLEPLLTDSVTCSNAFGLRSTRWYSYEMDAPRDFEPAFVGMVTTPTMTCSCVGLTYNFLMYMRIGPGVHLMARLLRNSGMFVEWSPYPRGGGLRKGYQSGN